ncbi:hypothetical protein [Natrarchaeobius chitinivorans]|uniref:hypothetical protein n=1 Tax=Natrarchaeobius chitinivorans TaxID=1679083 RepID=UPI001A9D56E2|nr:hypothetical protein [Natrarchaeobius chitinivorans]
MSSTKYVNVDRTLENLKHEVDSENFEAVKSFVDHCAAEGISEVQQDRLAWSWKTMLVKYAPKHFQVRNASETDLKTLMARVNRSDYADSTKVKFKTAVKNTIESKTADTNSPIKPGFSTLERRVPRSLEKTCLPKKS